MTACSRTRHVFVSSNWRSDKARWKMGILIPSCIPRREANPVIKGMSIAWQYTYGTCSPIRQQAGCVCVCFFGGVPERLRLWWCEDSITMMKSPAALEKKHDISHHQVFSRHWAQTVGCTASSLVNTQHRQPTVDIHNPSKFFYGHPIYTSRSIPPIYIYIYLYITWTVWLHFMNEKK